MDDRGLVRAAAGHHRESPAVVGRRGPAGADLVADWFRRNVRIYSNVIQLADSPTERLLVIFSAGHLGWLQHDFASDPTVRLRKLGEFAK